MKALLVSLCVVCCSIPTLAKQHLVPLETAKVISQQIGSYNAGAAVIPSGTMLLGVPITKRTNIVVVETAHYRLTWSEHGRHMLILPVNGTIRFYQDGKWFIVLDSNGKKHKFSILHEEAIGQ